MYKLQFTDTFVDQMQRLKVIADEGISDGPRHSDSEFTQGLSIMAPVNSLQPW